MTRPSRLLALLLLSSCAAGQAHLPPILVPQVPPQPVETVRVPPTVILVPAHRTHRGVKELGHHPGVTIHPPRQAGADAAPVAAEDTPAAIEEQTHSLDNLAVAEVTRPNVSPAHINAITIATARTHRAVEELHEHEGPNGRARQEDIAAVRAEADALAALVEQMQDKPRATAAAR